MTSLRPSASSTYLASASLRMHRIGSSHICTSGGTSFSSGAQISLLANSLALCMTARGLAVSDLPTCVTSKTGGRQGCKLGSITFNGFYAIALDMIRWELTKHEGVVLHLAPPEHAMWAVPDASAPPTQPVLDAAFVDDGALVLVSKTPCALDIAIDALLNTVFVVFDHLHLQLNANAGKTEALLMYRGKTAKARREARRGPDGRLRLAVPGRDVHINVVDEFKHLGTYASPLRTACATCDTARPPRCKHMRPYPSRYFDLHRWTTYIRSSLRGRSYCRDCCLASTCSC